MKKVSLPLVSVVIPSKNEEKNIGNCLQSIKNQTYPKSSIETIVVVNEDSMDRTKEIARKYTKNVFIKGLERSEPRNFGMLKKASGKYLIYLDADMTLSPTVIEKSVNSMENGDLVGLYLPEVILGNSYWSRVRRFERSFYDGTVVDCVRIIRKDIFEKAEGFNDSLSGPEDWDLDKKIKKFGRVDVLGKYNFKGIDEKLERIDYLANDLAGQLSRVSSLPLVYHNEALFSVKKYFQKKGYYAKSFNAYVKKWGENDPDIKRQFGFWYRYFGVFLEDGKYKKIFNNPFLAIGMFFLRILTGITFLLSKY